MNVHNKSYSIDKIKVKNEKNKNFNKLKIILIKFGTVSSISNVLQSPCSKYKYFHQQLMYI